MCESPREIPSVSTPRPWPRESATPCDAQPRVALMRITAQHLQPPSVASPYCRLPYSQPLRLLTQTAIMLLLNRGGVGIAGLDSDVEVKASTPASRGLGLFAQRSLEPGELIGPYTGIVASQTDYIKARIHQQTSGSYAVAVNTPWAASKCFYVDAEPCEARCLASFINHSRRRQNCEFTELVVAPMLPAVPFVRVTRPVAAGSELFVDYGESYWDDVPGLDVPWSIQRLIVDYW